MRPYPFLLVALVVCGSGSKTRAPTSFVFGCDSLLLATLSLENLRGTFGASNVTRDSVPLGEVEGQMVPASVLFSGEPTRRLLITWKDTALKRLPKSVVVDQGPSAWHTTEGITIGTSLEELEVLNGRPFVMAGFAFDGSGAITSWENGQLATLKSGRCPLMIWLDSLSNDPAARSWYAEVQGDGDFKSSHPAMRALNPRVSQMRLDYR